MNEELNRKLEQAEQGIARCEKIDSMLRQLELEQTDLTAKERKLKAVLDKEDLDVEKLEGKSIASVFYSFLGNIDAHLQKERSEAIAAKLKYDQSVQDLQDVNRRITDLKNERESYADCRREYESLYEQKKKQLLQESGEATHQLLEITNKINRARINQKEIKEAVDAGNIALESISSVMSSLDSAEGWGTWDLLGGGLLSDLAKHSNIDDAKAEVERTQMYLRNFRTELADIQIDSDLHIDIGGFAKFADFFFDGLIADWYMQTKIHDSQNNVENVERQVEDVLDKLGKMLNEESANIEKWDAEIRELVEHA